jgi:hypothetical protein
MLKRIEKYVADNERATEQFNGREAKTATFYHGFSFPSRCRLPVFAHVISTVGRLRVNNVNR